MAKGNRSMLYVYILGAVLCWGLYGPMLHIGQVGLGNSAMRALLMVGLAYFAIAVLYPAAVILGGNEGGAFTFKGSTISFLTGALGAIGALCIIFSFKAFQASGVTGVPPPLFVMPLVFGGAPIVNVVFSMIQHPPEKGTQISPLLYVGFALAAAGAYLILKFKPA